jgi:hypothetical protein
MDEPRASGGQAGFLIANKRGARTLARRKFLHLAAGCSEPTVKGRHVEHVAAGRGPQPVFPRHRY